MVLGLAATSAGAGELPPSDSASSGSTGDFNVNLEAAQWDDGSDFWRVPSGDRTLSYFTPRLGALQLGPSYLPAADPRAGDGDPAAANSEGRGLAVNIELPEALGDINVGLAGGVHGGALPHARSPNQARSASAEGSLRGYGVNLNLGYGSFTLTGAYAREVSNDLVVGNIWDAGIAYDTGPWTFGVSYLYSQFETAAPAYQSEDQVRAISGEVSYSIGPGFYARAQLSHAQWEDSSGVLSYGTVGILGLRYNF